MPIVGPDRIDEVIACIRAGGVAGIPTDTVYGLAALPDHPGALAALADLKGRDRDQPVAALLDTPEGATRFLDDP
ncbi:MAG: threonylcarbamoyl-AMP synthase, partial [Chloroflexi bacterium HGW-Chloroflexi-9]